MKRLPLPGDQVRCICGCGFGGLVVSLSEDHLTMRIRDRDYPESISVWPHDGTVRLWNPDADLAVMNAEWEALS
jgi:hypothetical protein